MKIISTIIVYSAGIIGAITSLPQLYQIIKTKQVRDINPWFFVLHILSDALFLTYGVLTNDYLLMYSMLLPCTFNTLIFVLCLYYETNDGQSI